MLEQVVRKVHIRCKPEHIPPHILVDVTDLNIGDAFHVSDLDLEDDTIEILSSPGDVLYHVQIPRLMEDLDAVKEEDEEAIEEGEEGEEGETVESAE